MPSKQKTLLFFAGFVSSIGSFAAICTCLGTQQWVSSRVQFLGGNYTGEAHVNLGLFVVDSRKTITSGVALDTQKISKQVFDLLKETNSVKIAHIIVILFLVLGLACCFMGSVTTCLNSVSNPYITFLGPLGVYVWSSINAIFVLLAMIVFAVNIEANNMPKNLAKAMDITNDVYGTSTNTYGYSYYLLILSICLNLATTGIIYYYQHIRYSKQKEQERPMEIASKDSILF
ncbi:PREDICTED: clarin-3 [Nanorana parkeri]|uniref:clarin-3 n=1 Tax=Nanorana parkeri TaxID=125878 RepID=UPI0008545211|nr:PREDICTED: clarin-3 [Nanorana parkeri]